MDPIWFVSYDSNPKYENIWSVHWKGEKSVTGLHAVLLVQHAVIALSGCLGSVVLNVETTRSIELSFFVVATARSW